MKRTYTEQQKQEILNFNKSHTFTETLRRYNIGPTMLVRWKDPDRHKILTKQYNKVYYKNNILNLLSQQKKYYFKNSNKIKDYSRIYRGNNKEYFINYSRQYYADNKEKLLQNYKEYKRNNKEQIKEITRKYVHYRYKTDPTFRLKFLLRARLKMALREQNARKNTKTFDLVGCSIKELKNRRETQFQEGMAWNNYGEWHIDHIRPCSSFDLLKIEEQKKCFHYTNLQPLWAKDNLRKGDKYSE